MILLFSVVKILISTIAIISILPNPPKSNLPNPCNNYCISDYYNLIKSECLNNTKSDQDLVTKCSLYCQTDFIESKHDNCHVNDHESEKFRYIMFNKQEEISINSNQLYKSDIVLSDSDKTTLFQYCIDKNKCYLDHNDNTWFSNKNLKNLYNNYPNSDFPITCIEPIKKV